MAFKAIYPAKRTSDKRTGGRRSKSKGPRPEPQPEPQPQRPRLAHLADSADADRGSGRRPRREAGPPPVRTWTMTPLRARFARLVSPGTGFDEVVAHAPQLPLREVIRRFWPDARPYRRWLPVLLVAIALGALIETAEIWAFKLVVDDVLVPGDLGALGWIAARSTSA